CGCGDCGDDACAHSHDRVARRPRCFQRDADDSVARRVTTRAMITLSFAVRRNADLYWRTTGRAMPAVGALTSSLRFMHPRMTPSLSHSARCDDRVNRNHPLHVSIKWAAAAAIA